MAWFHYCHAVLAPQNCPGETWDHWNNFIVLCVARSERKYYCQGVTHTCGVVTFISRYRMNIRERQKNYDRISESSTLELTMVAYDGSHRNPANNSHHRWSQLVTRTGDKKYLWSEQRWKLFAPADARKLFVPHGWKLFHRALQTVFDSNCWTVVFDMCNDVTNCVTNPDWRPCCHTSGDHTTKPLCIVITQVWLAPWHQSL